MKNTKKLTEKVKSVFTKKYGRTAVEGEEPTFHTSKTYGGTIPYLPGKFKEEYSKDNEEIDVSKTKKSSQQKKTQNKSNKNNK